MSTHLQTLFTGRQLITPLKTDSTNSFLKERLSESTVLEGTVVVTQNQTNGKGQAGNQWQSEPGKNLTFSVLYRPTFLSADKQFFLNMAVALGVKDFCESILEEEVKIKWPNDIYFENKKLAGILIENSVSAGNLQTAVIGIGLNVNQTSFPAELPNTTSLVKIKNTEFNLNEMQEKLCNYLEKYYLQLRALHFNFLDKAYTTSLFRYSHTATFKKGKETFKGQIVGVTKEGKLIIESNGKELKFGLKEVEFVI